MNKNKNKVKYSNIPQMVLATILVVGIFTLAPTFGSNTKKNGMSSIVYEEETPVCEATSLDAQKVLETIDGLATSQLTNLKELKALTNKLQYCEM